MTKAAAGRAAGYGDMDHVYSLFKNQNATGSNLSRGQLVEEVKFDKQTATNISRAHRKSANATEEKCRRFVMQAPRSICLTMQLK